jgi:hypothetical protein
MNIKPVKTLCPMLAEPIAKRIKEYIENESINQPELQIHLFRSFTHDGISGWKEVVDVFSGLFFLTIFLPAVLILNYISKNRTYRNTILTIMSLMFYAWGEPVFVLLLLLTSAFVYIIAPLIQKNSESLYQIFTLYQVYP